MRVAILMTLALLAAPAAAGELDALAWLEGSWERETKSGLVVESWRPVSTRTMEGSVRRIGPDGESRETDDPPPDRGRVTALASSGHGNVLGSSKPASRATCRKKPAAQPTSSSLPRARCAVTFLIRIRNVFT